ncbi:MAG: Hsp33 family molecular chaperone HslO [Candidatus Kapaibacterium sp.]
MNREEELKKQYQLRDRAVRILTKNGKYRAVAVKNTATAREAQERHNLGQIPAFLLARTLSAASLIASFLKGEERVIVEAEGAGPVKKVFAEALQLGEVRGFVNLTGEPGQYEIRNIGEALGAGILRVSRVLYNKAEPLQSVIPLQTGDIATDLAYFYLQSEQIPSAVVLDADFDEDGKIRYSGGFIIQAMPGATPEDNQLIFDAISEVNSLAPYFNIDSTPADMLKDIMPFDYEIIKSTQIDFFCRCSKDNFIEKMMTLDKNEIIEMQNEGSRELVCQYCNEKYLLEDVDFDKMIEEMQAREN